MKHIPNNISGVTRRLLPSEGGEDGFMKMKTTPLALLVIGLMTIVVVTPIHATYSIATYVRADKSSYLPGDSGTLFVTVKNLIPSQSFTVRNITVNYPWMAFITDHWDGNFTVTGINAPVGTPGGMWNAQYGFTVPTDGRAYQNGGLVGIHIGTDIPPPNENAIINTSANIVVAIASYQPVGLANLVPIVSLILLAAAVVMLVLVFFGLRRMSKK